MKIITFSLLCLFGLSSCYYIDLPKLGNETVEKGEYDILIYGPNTKTHLIGKDVGTQWIPEEGWIYLGTDEKLENKPIGTITLQVGALKDCEVVIFNSQGKNDTIETSCLSIIDALVSKTERRIGTAPELDAKLFQVGVGEPDLSGNRSTGSITHVDLGSNFVRGFLRLAMDRVITNPNDPNAVPEKVLVMGEFTAISR